MAKVDIISVSGNGLAWLNTDIYVDGEKLIVDNFTYSLSVEETDKLIIWAYPPESVEAEKLIFSRDLGDEINFKFKNKKVTWREVVERK